MYRINLAPGQRPRRARRGLAVPSLRLPNLRGSRWGAFAIAAWIAAPALVGWQHIGDGRERSGLETALDAARVDSTRLAGIHAADAALRAREDTIRSKLEVITGLDGGRYVWAHIVDELARALPQHVWLTEVVFLSTDAPLDAPRFAINGRSGTTFALTELLRALDASAFLQDITLIQTSQVTEGEARVYSFAIEAQYRAPERSLLDFEAVIALEEE